MIILVHAVKVKDDWHALLCIVVVVAAKEEAIWIRRIVVAVIKREIKIRFVYPLAQLSQFSAHHLRTDHVNIIRSGKIPVTRICVPQLLASANHVNRKSVV